MIYHMLAFSAVSHASEIMGRIVLLPEKNGEAWYINPLDGKRYYLNRPGDALEIMRRQGTGISEENLAKIKPAVSHLSGGDDSDEDGLPDTFERAMGTDPHKTDTSGNGYDDRTEIRNGYDPLKKEGKLPLDEDFAEHQAGGIFLQVEKSGEAWYINPQDNLRYFLGRPDHAFHLMRDLALGVTEDKLKEIPRGDAELGDETSDIDPEEEENGETDKKTEPPEENCPECSSEENNEGNKGADTAAEAIKKAEGAIRRGDKDQAVDYFIEDMQQAVTYTVDFLDKEGRYTLANILSGSEASSSEEEEVIYSNSVNFDDEEVEIDFRVEKRNGKWFMASL